MSKVKQLLEFLGFEIKSTGSQLQIDCPACGDQKKHLYIDPVKGVGYCHKCGFSPNPYKMIEKVTSKSPTEIMRLLNEFGLTDERNQISDVRTAKKVIALDANDMRQLTDDEIKRFCEVKQLNQSALNKFRPVGHSREPWLMLPAYSPGNPSKACGWLRCRLDGKPITLKNGNSVKYPIVPGSKHGLFGVKWLMQENPDRIVFCEAWRDALAAISIGVHATASSGGASKWDDDWLPLFAGKEVYICMDADKAGQRAAQRAAERIATVAKGVFIAKLPYDIRDSHGKDVHDYIVREGNGNRFMLLLNNTEKYVPNDIDTCQVNEQVLLSNNHALTVASAMHKDLMANGLIKRHYNFQGQWCDYTGIGYQLCDHLDTQNLVWRYAAKCRVPSRGKDAPPAALNCSDSVVKNTLSAMRSFEDVDIPASVTAPAWLNGKSGPAPEYIITVNNGLLDVTDEPKLLQHTPDFLNFNMLPYDYIPTAKCPVWIKFLEQVFAIVLPEVKGTIYEPGTGNFIELKETIPDEEKIMSLQEWFGLFLIKEMKYQKMLGIIGPKRSGKGTISRILTALIGSSNIATPTFSSLVDSFGLQGLLNATVAIFGDANMDKDPVVVSRAIEKLKTISGCDGIDVNRKFETVIQGARLNVRFVMISNNLQRLTDPTGTVSDRFIFLKTTQSFYGREDLDLEKRLINELPGILNWALEGLRRLKERGYIFEPQESVQMRTQSKELGSNVIAFVNSACRKGEKLYTLPDDMYEAFKRWCEADGSKPMRKRAFRQEFNEAFSEHACSKHRVGSYENPIAVYWQIEPHVAYMYNETGTAYY